MLKNMRGFLSTILNNRASTSSSYSFPNCIKTDGKSANNSIPKYCLYLPVTSIVTDTSIYPNGTTFILSSKKQIINDDMYTFDNLVTELSPISSSTVSASNERVCNINLVAQNETMNDIVINSIGVVTYGILLDAFNVSEIVVKPKQIVTFNFSM